MKPNRIVLNDAVAALKKFPTEIAQLVIADPPYFQLLPRAWDQQWPDAAGYLDWSFICWPKRCARRWQFHDLII